MAQLERHHLSRDFVEAILEPGGVLSYTLDHPMPASAGIDAARVHASQEVLRIRARCADPPDLALLQVGMAVCQSLVVEAGASAVLDEIMVRWRSTDWFRALPPERPFDIWEHVWTVFEVGGEGTGHVCNTRGLAKFARPEFFMRGLRPDDATMAGGMLGDLAWNLAEGKSYGPGSGFRLNLPGGRSPLVTFVEHREGLDGTSTHGLGPNKFGERSMEVIDVDMESGAPMSGCAQIIDWLHRAHR